MAISKSFKHGSKCVYCGCTEPLYFTIDHIKPKAKGGTDALENLQTTCVLCNFFKGSRSDKDFKLMLKHLGELHKIKAVSVNASGKINVYLS